MIRCTLTVWIPSGRKRPGGGINLSSSPQSTLEVGGCSGRERLLLPLLSVPAGLGAGVVPLLVYVYPIALKAFSCRRFFSSSKKVIPKSQTTLQF